MLAGIAVAELVKPDIHQKGENNQEAIVAGEADQIGPDQTRAENREKVAKMSLVKKTDEEDQQIIKPEAVAPNVNTADWPLLLKNWDQCA